MKQEHLFSNKNDQESIKIEHRSNQMYSNVNFGSKKELKIAVLSGQKIGIYAPGLGNPVRDGVEFLSGPWYPKPHKWYAEVVMKDGYIIKVK